MFCPILPTSFNKNRVCVFNIMVDPQYSKNIILTLAGLPDFLRKSMLKQRLAEFYTLSPDQQQEIIDGVLANAPEIPFDNLARLLKTWLITVCALSEEERKYLLAKYATEACSNPTKFVSLNLDGMLEVFLSLDSAQRITIAKSIKDVIQAMGKPCYNKLLILIPENAKKQMGI